MEVSTREVRDARGQLTLQFFLGQIRRFPPAHGQVALQVFDGRPHIANVAPEFRVPLGGELDLRGEVVPHLEDQRPQGVGVGRRASLVTPLDDLLAVAALEFDEVVRLGVAGGDRKGVGEDDVEDALPLLLGVAGLVLGVADAPEDGVVGRGGLAAAGADQLYHHAALVDQPPQFNPQVAADERERWLHARLIPHADQHAGHQVARRPEVTGCGRDKDRGVHGRGPASRSRGYSTPA